MRAPIHFTFKILAIGLLLVYGPISFGQVKTKVEIGPEYLFPLEDDRDVQTTSINFLYSWERFGNACRRRGFVQGGRRSLAR